MTMSLRARFDRAVLRMVGAHSRDASYKYVEDLRKAGFKKVGTSADRWTEWFEHPETEERYRVEYGPQPGQTRSIARDAAGPDGQLDWSVVAAGAGMWQVTCKGGAWSYDDRNIPVFKPFVKIWSIRADSREEALAQVKRKHSTGDEGLMTYEVEYYDTAGNFKTKLIRAPSAKLAVEEAKRRFPGKSYEALRGRDASVEIPVESWRVGVYMRAPATRALGGGSEMARRTFTCKARGPNEAERKAVAFYSDKGYTNISATAEGTVHDKAMRARAHDCGCGCAQCGDAKPVGSMTASQIKTELNSNPEQARRAELLSALARLDRTPKETWEFGKAMAERGGRDSEAGEKFVVVKNDRAISKEYDTQREAVQEAKKTSGAWVESRGGKYDGQVAWQSRDTATAPIVQVDSPASEFLEGLADLLLGGDAKDAVNGVPPKDTMSQAQAKSTGETLTQYCDTTREVREWCRGEGIGRATEAFVVEGFLRQRQREGLSVAV